MSSHKRNASGSDTVLREPEPERATMIAVNVNADSQLINADPKLTNRKC